MENKKTLANITKVTLSNICIVISGIFVGFLIPKVLGVVDYGFYKTFTLYSTYVGIFTFGISEGIYLRFSGISYEKIDKKLIAFYTHVVFVVEIIVSILMLLISILFLKDEYKIIFIFLSIYTFDINITTYYQYIAQMTMRFKEYSMRNFVKSLLTIISTLCMLFLFIYNDKNEIGFYYYLICVVFISTIMTLLYVLKFKDITFVKGKVDIEEKKQFKGIIKNGISFLIASMCSTLILSIDRQFVSVLFETSEYGIYAFAYNMLALVTVCTSAISTVLYPTLKRTYDTDLKNTYSKLVSYILIFVAFMMLAYFPLVIIVKYFLPNYIESLAIFRIVFPGLIFSSVISVVMHNYYKLLNKNWNFFIINVVILCISIGANFLAYYLWKSTKAISWASIICILIWYVISELMFIKKYKVNFVKNDCFAIVIVCSFYLITEYISNIYISFGVYFIIYAVCTIIFYFQELKKMLKNKKGDIL